jgi:hypothetical protein
LVEKFLGALAFGGLSLFVGNGAQALWQVGEGALLFRGGSSFLDVFSSGAALF